MCLWPGTCLEFLDGYTGTYKSPRRKTGDGTGEGSSGTSDGEDLSRAIDGGAPTKEDASGSGDDQIDASHSNEGDVLQWQSDSAGAGTTCPASDASIMQGWSFIDNVV